MNVRLLTPVALALLAGAVARPCAQQRSLFLGSSVDSPRMYEAGDGRVLHVASEDGEPISTDSSSVLTLRRGEETVWTTTLPFAVASAAVGRGTTCAVAGVDAIEDGSRPATRLVLCFLADDGTVNSTHAIERVFGGSPDSGRWPRVASLEALPSSWRYLVRTRLDSARGSWEEWEVYSSSGRKVRTIPAGGLLLERGFYTWAEGVLTLEGVDVVASIWRGPADTHDYALGAFLIGDWVAPVSEGWEGPCYRHIVQRVTTTGAAPKLSRAVHEGQPVLRCDAEGPDGAAAWIVAQRGHGELVVEPIEPAAERPR